MTLLDCLYAALIAVYLLADHLVVTPMFRRRLGIDPRMARRWWCSTFVGVMSLFTAAGALLWVDEQRSWQDIALSFPAGWRLWGSFAVVLGFGLLQAWSGYAVRESARKKESVRKQLVQLGTAIEMLPHEAADFPGYVAASVAAGIGEEFLCRGYLIWMFHHWMGWWVAAIASLAIFAVGHSYQGRQGVLRAALGGALLTIVVAGFGSLLPAMAIHALVDIGSGYIAWLALRENVLRPA